MPETSETSTEEASNATETKPERRESCDTGYCSLENGEIKQTEESLEIQLKDALKPTDDLEIKEPKPVPKKCGRPRKNPKKEPKKKDKVDDPEKESDEPRRSSRLKSKSENNPRMEDLLNSISINEIEKYAETRLIEGCDIPPTPSGYSASENGNDDQIPQFQQILENEYLTERSISKDAERMICDCVLTKEEILRGEKGCGEDCLNRLLLIECCSRCTLGDRCSNKRFHKREYAKCEVYKTKKKGCGLRCLEDIPSGTFIMEYVGEVLDSDEFERRAMEYARGKSPHFYFMSLKSDCIIDATVKGSISRFINHSCEPNAETQKWTVQGELRIGFFSKRAISAGEEITFDYQLQRYGKQAQRCYCETPSCSGWIGENPEKQQSDEKRKEKKKKKEDSYQDLETALDEIYQVGLINRHQTLSLNRLMVHAKELPVRMQILQLIEEGQPSCRRLFVDYHGLPIIWSWMIDCTPEQEELKTQILKTLLALPITNKTVLTESKVLPCVEQWAYAINQKPHSEQLSAQSVLESVEDIASAEETPVSELAQKVLEIWSSLREAYKIPKKERIQQMKEHEREADQNVVKPRPKRLPLYVENMRERFHRNRHHRDKDFEKIYYDRMNDYEKCNYSNNFDPRKRKDSPDPRPFDNRNKQRKFDYKDNPTNKISKMEHRYMFEMKFREKERKEEEEYRRWYQNQSIFYSTQQHQMTQSMMGTNQFMSSVPPNFNAEKIFSNLQSVTATPSSTFYQNTPPPNMYSNVVLPPTHIPPPALPSIPQPIPSIMTPSVSASPQTYYQNQVSVPSYPSPAVPYAHQTINENPPVKTSPIKDTYTYDYRTLVEEVTAPEEQKNAEVKARLEQYPETKTSTTTNTNGTVKEINPLNIDIDNLKLPPKWKTARDSEGRLYFYHTKTRVSRWYPPVWEEEEEEEEEEIEVTDEESSEDESSGEEEEEKEEEDEQAEGSDEEGRKTNGDEYEMDQGIGKLDSHDEDNANTVLQSFDVDYEQYMDRPPSGIPLVTEHIISPREPIDEDERIRNKLRRRYLKEKMKKRKKQKLLMNGSLNGYNGSRSKGEHGANGISSSVPADTSENLERKKKDSFRFHMADFIVTCLNPYFRSSCTQARITNYGDFKHLARKLTHFVMLKELKHCQNVTDLNCNASVKYKAREYVKKYMSKFDEVYVRPLDDSNY